MTVKIKILAASLFLSLAPSCAFAVDWSVKSTVSETVELNDNQFMKTMLAGGTLGSYTTINADAEAKTPTSRFNFDSDVTYRKYWGPGTDGVRMTEFLSDGFKARYETTGKDPNDKNYLEAQLRQSSTALALLSDLGVQTSVPGTLDVSTVRGGIERAITHQDFVTLSARSTYTNSDPPGGTTTFTDSDALGTWRHRINSTVALMASSELEWLSFNNSTNTNIMILREMAGLDATLSPVLSFRGTAGDVYIKTDQSNSTISPTAIPLSSASVTDFITDMLLTYKMFKDTTLTLSGTQSVGPSVVGSLTKRISIRAGLFYTINGHSSLALSADASRLVTSSSTDFYSASVGYNYQLAREWNASVTYRFLHRAASSSSSSGSSIFDPITGTPIVLASGTGPANSNSVLVVVSHSLTVLPRGN